MHRTGLSLLACLLLAPALAGCAAFPSASPAAPQGDPVAWSGPATGPWMTHTTGCGFCGPSDAAWAGTLVLYEDGNVLWFSFRPHTGFEDDDLSGIVVPAEHEALRPYLEDAIGLLARDDVYWTSDGDVQVYDVEVGRLSDADKDIVLRLRDWTEDLEDAPPITDYGCEDCASPQVQTTDPAAFGIIMEKGRNGPGTGNVPAGSDWDRTEEQLHILHDWLEPQPS